MKLFFSDAHPSVLAESLYFCVFDVAFDGFPPFLHG